VRIGRVEPAIADFRRAIAILDKVKTGELYRTDFTSALAHALVDAGKFGEALALLDKLEVTDETSPATVILIRYNLGRAKVATRRDVRGGIADVRAARAGADAAKLPASDIAAIDAWLARHAK
jgi:hypothetical protein